MTNRQLKGGGGWGRGAETAALTSQINAKYLAKTNALLTNMLMDCRGRERESLKIFFNLASNLNR